MKTNKQKLVEVFWLLTIIGFFVVSIFLTKNGVLQDRLATFGIFAPFILVLLKISTLVIAPLGGIPLYVLAGALFGSWQGFLLCFLGDVLGSVISFMIGRYYGERVVKFFVGEVLFKKIIKFTSLLSDTKSFIKARLVAVNLPEVLAYAAGLSRINFWKFLVLHMPLYVVSDILFVFLGEQIVNLSTGHTFIAIGVALVVSGTSLFFLLKDYRKVEGM